MTGAVVLRRQDELTSDERGALWHLLLQVDHEFIPPLSHRDSTIMKHLAGVATTSAQPTAYFERLIGQVSLLVMNGRDLQAFLSFIPGHSDPVIAAWSPCSYVSTVAVFPSARRAGAARRLYESLLALPPDLASPFVATRTWSTNIEHLRLLESIGFHEVVHLPDDRGPGLATVYYARPVAGASTGIGPS